MAGIGEGARCAAKYPADMRTVLFLAIFLLFANALSSDLLGRLHQSLAESIRAGAPFSFTYDGKNSKDLLPHWRRERQAKRLDANRKQETVTYRDPETKLEIRTVEVEYRDFPAVEWTVYAKNLGNQDTPILENLQALDVEIQRPGAREFLLHHNVGSHASRDDYMPLDTPLEPGKSIRLGGAGGRPTDSDLSYFNLAAGDEGTILVVGWPGQWAASFQRDQADGLHLTAGQELTHFRLHPGEEVRTPLIVALDWKGDWIDGQNQWRRWMMAYGMPKPGGLLPKPMMLGSSGRQYREMIGANEANQIEFIDRYLAEGLKLDYWWMDAGWYVQQRGWPQVGTWEVDTKRFPHGFKAISDHAHAHGMKILVWFEPERVAPDTWLSNNHPEWLLNPLKALEVLNSSKLTSSEPLVLFNPSGEILSWNGITWTAHSLSFHPGPNGEYSSVRWTAPLEGDYKVEAKFAGIDDKPTTTDVHVLSKERALFDGFINLNGQGNTASYSGTVHFKAGETLDFAIGYGNRDYSFDSTGLDVAVTGPDGIRHEAAREYKGANWSYGWLASGEKTDPATFQAYDRETRGGGNGDQLLDLGNPVAWQWLVEHVDKLIVDNGIDLYRQDFNIEPLSFWRGNDAPDRQGITENKYVVGFLAYWDELRRRHPNMLIDSCASGGRRNDLETMRRAVPLWRSDYAYEPIGHQGMTYGLSMWLPYHGTGTVADVDAPYYGEGLTTVQPYAFWSNVAPSLGHGYDVREKGLDYATLRRLFAEWREMSRFFYGDFYPLTPFSHEESAWIGWQFNSTYSGVLLAFRRQKAPETLVVKPSGLDPKTTYVLQVLDRDGGEVVSENKATGADLMKKGITLRSAKAPSAIVVEYARAISHLE